MNNLLKISILTIAFAYIGFDLYSKGILTPGDFDQLGHGWRGYVWEVLLFVIVSLALIRVVFLALNKSDRVD